MGSTDDDERFMKLVKVQQAVFRRTGVRKFGAFGTAIGMRIRQSADGNRETDSLCLRVFVYDKPPLDQVPVTHRLGKQHTFDLADGPVTVDIDICRTGRPQLHRLSVAQKAVVDVSDTQQPNEGTIGGWAWDKRRQCIVMLSNAHVFGRQSHKMVRLRGVPIGQTRRSAITRLSAAGRVDAAIADPIGESGFDPVIPEIGPGIFAIERVRRGIDVVKRGATTGMRRGVVDAVKYDMQEAGIHMEDGIAVSPHEATWTRPGDSGGVLFLQNSLHPEGLPQAVGLHFAGVDELGLAFHIGDVFDALDLAPLSELPFVSFLDGIFAPRTSEPPFEFMRLRRRVHPPNRPHDSKGQQLYNHLRASSDAQFIARLFRSHRVALLRTLVTDAALRWQLYDAFRPLFSGVAIAEALDRPIQPASQRHFENLLAQLSLDAQLREEVAPLRAVVADAQGKSLSALFRALTVV